MKYVIVKDIERKECEHTDGTKTQILEIIFKKGDKELRVLIKDIKEEDIDDNVKQAKKKAKDWFNNQESILLK